jgi:hypothetical protein
MSMMLEEDESFSMSAYVTTPGYQGVVLQGYLVEHRGDGTYIAPLIPQLFYGVGGTQLQTWRQNFTATGDQVILSRSGGLPTVPREELYWRKVSDHEIQKEEVKAVETPVPQYWIIPVGILGIVIGGYVFYRLLKS